MASEFAALLDHLLQQGGQFAVGNGGLGGDVGLLQGGADEPQGGQAGLVAALSGQPWSQPSVGRAWGRSFALESHVCRRPLACKRLRLAGDGDRNDTRSQTLDGDPADGPAGAGGRHGDRRAGPRRHGIGGRRGMLQYGHHRLPGDPDRPLLRRADHHLHLPPHRQRRRPTRRIPKPPTWRCARACAAACCARR